MIPAVLVPPTVARKSSPLRRAPNQALKLGIQLGQLLAKVLRDESILADSLLPGHVWGRTLGPEIELAGACRRWQGSSDSRLPDGGQGRRASENEPHR